MKNPWACFFLAFLFGPLGAASGGLMAFLLSIGVSIVAFAVFGAGGFFIAWPVSIIAAVKGCKEHNQNYELREFIRKQGKA